MRAGSFYISKDNCKHPQGHDAHFICQQKQTIAVADGVGSWVKRNVDPGIYARELLSNCLTAIQNTEGDINLKLILQRAHSETISAGSSTACMLTVKDKILHAVNMGDSKFILLREGKTVYQSPTQQHSFNHPYQLGTTSKDSPNLVQVIEHKIRCGDVVVMGTDGLFDNVSIPEIEMVVSMAVEDGKDPEDAAWILAEYAFHSSNDKGAWTPFMLASGGSHRGGKLDDITIIVAYL